MIFNFFYRAISFVLRRGRNFIFSFRFGSCPSSSYVRHPILINGGKHIYIGKNCFVMDGIRMETVKKWCFAPPPPPDVVHTNSIIRRNLRSESTYNPRIEIKDHVLIGQNCHITAANLVSIGNGVNILPQVLITDMEHNHEFNKSAMDTPLTVGSVVIEDYAFIGMGAKIMGAHGIRIGRSAVVGANAVVTKDVPERAIVVGVPAIVIGHVK